nr:PREDICTED: uncharacterized protein LOC109031970 [Bemisia tabaci]XP_018899378.1 PREDICTED: uncharacterized protein LOC109031970 [Bemisia tabaci]
MSEDNIVMLIQQQRPPPPPPQPAPYKTAPYNTAPPGWGLGSAGPWQQQMISPGAWATAQPATLKSEDVIDLVQKEMRTAREEVSVLTTQFTYYSYYGPKNYVWMSLKRRGFEITNRL